MTMPIMPNFLVIGMPASGTTSLYHYLKQHPQIRMSPMKEPHFFEFGEPDQLPLELPPRPWAVQTLPDYQALFRDVTTQTAIGEASPSNFYARGCARIHAYLPEARLICILRQPVERAYSVYKLRQNQNRAPEGDFRKASADLYWLTRSDLTAGWYVRRLQDWLSRFPHEQMHFGLLDDLRAAPAVYMRALYAFLKVDEAFTPDVSRVHHRGESVRSLRLNRLLRHNHGLKTWVRRWLPATLWRPLARGLQRLNQTPIPPLDPEMRRELTLLQRADILRLQELTGCDLTRWLAG